MLPLCSPSSFFSGQWALQEMSAERTSFPRIRRILFPASCRLLARRIEWLDHSPVMYTPVAIHSPCHLVHDRLVLRDSDHCAFRRSGSSVPEWN